MACVIVAAGLSLGALSGCDSLLEVNLPASLTDEAVNDPQGALTLVNSIIGHFESGWNRKTWDSHGREHACEVILQSPGVEDPCAFDATIDPDLYDPISISRSFAATLHAKLASDWDASQVPDRDEFLALASIYEGANIEVMAEHLCEVTIDGGPLMTPAAAYAIAETRLTTAIAEVNSAGDFEVMHGISTSAKSLAYGLRARVRWALGNLSGALADANEVPQGFTAWVTREPGLARRNLAAHHGPIIGYAKLYGLIDFWHGGSNPVTGAAWPSPLPFSGYRNLGILPDGRAIRDEDQLPIRTSGSTDGHPGIEATAVEDTRVKAIPGVIQGSSESTFLHARYLSEGDDLPWVNWKEMVLIAAEATGGQGAIDKVNVLRTADNLPLVTYADPGNAQQIKEMIIEERRRALFLEGRFYATKLLNPDLLWFPRAQGHSVEKGEAYNGAVKHLMPESEYVLNENLTEALRATGCAPALQPVAW
jgi:hypothetical protein